MPRSRPNADAAPALNCQRCTIGALALVLVGAFVGLAVADWSERSASAARQQDAIVQRAAAAVNGALDLDSRLLDQLTAEPGAPSLATQDLLAVSHTLVPGVKAALLLASDGTVLAGAPDGADRSVIERIAAEARAALSTPDAPALYLSGALRDRDHGIDLIGLARARRTADGTFAGIALIAVDTASLVPPEMRPPEGALTIRRNDGAVLFRTGSGTEAAGAEAVVARFPVAVSYDRDISALGHAWRRIWLRNGAVVGGVGLLAALGAAFLDRRRRRAAERAAETRAREALTLRQNAADLAKAATRADEASRAKSRFVAQVTHELRTPLNAIIGFSEAIRREMFGPVANPRYVEYGALIHTAGSHLLSLINDLLDIAKIEEGKLEVSPIRVSAAALARSTLDLVELLARDRNVALAVVDVETCPDLTADPRAAKQVLVNLLSNAIKFTPPGGRIALTFAGRTDGGVAITVADTGAGMSAEEIALAFEPFGRAAGDKSMTVPGTGLGLPIARALVRLHGGELSLTSHPGRGTLATVIFPADAAATRPLAVLPPAQAA
jgi:signal transduction histidine kinase